MGGVGEVAYGAVQLRAPVRTGTAWGIALHHGTLLLHNFCSIQYVQQSIIYSASLHQQLHVCINAESCLHASSSLY